MAAGSFRIVIEQGATLTLPIEVFEADGTTPRSLSAVTIIRMQIREFVDSPTTIDDLTLAAADFAWDDQPNGKFTLTIADTATAAYSIVDAVYDIELVSPAGVERLLQGPVFLSYEVTR